MLENSGAEVLFDELDVSDIQKSATHRFFSIKASDICEIFLIKNSSSKK